MTQINATLCPWRPTPRLGWARWIAVCAAALALGPGASEPPALLPESTPWPDIRETEVAELVAADAMDIPTIPGLPAWAALTPGRYEGDWGGLPASFIIDHLDAATATLTGQVILQRQGRTQQWPFRMRLPWRSEGDGVLGRLSGQAADLLRAVWLPEHPLLSRDAQGHFFAMFSGPLLLPESSAEASVARDQDEEPAGSAQATAPPAPPAVRPPSGWATLYRPVGHDELPEQDVPAAAVYLPGHVAAQTAYWSCGPNSLARLLAFYGHEVTYTGIKGDLMGASEMGGLDFALGTRPDALRGYLERYEQSAALARQAQWDELLAVVSLGRPVIVLVRVGTRQMLGLDVPMLHWKLVLGYDPHTQRLTIGDTNAGYYQMERQAFLAEWDWTAPKGLVAQTLAQAGVQERTMVWVRPETQR